jgi:hypothetical protein
MAKPLLAGFADLFAGKADVFSSWSIVLIWNNARSIASRFLNLTPILGRIVFNPRVGA